MITILERGKQEAEQKAEDIVSVKCREVSCTAQAILEELCSACSRAVPANWFDSLQLIRPIAIGPGPL